MDQQLNKSKRVTKLSVREKEKDMPPSPLSSPESLDCRLFAVECNAIEGQGGQYYVGVGIIVIHISWFPIPFPTTTITLRLKFHLFLFIRPT